MKTVGELKEFLNDIPDHVLIGGRGHYGEFLECYGVNYSEIRKSINDSKLISVVTFSIEDAGEEPD